MQTEQLKMDPTNIEITVDDKSDGELSSIASPSDSTDSQSEDETKGKLEKLRKQKEKLETKLNAAKRVQQKRKVISKKRNLEEDFKDLRREIRKIKIFLRQIQFCTYCRRTGHTIRQCRRKPRGDGGRNFD